MGSCQRGCTSRWTLGRCQGGGPLGVGTRGSSRRRAQSASRATTAGRASCCPDPTRATTRHQRRCPTRLLGPLVRCLVAGEPQPGQWTPHAQAELELTNSLRPEQLQSSCRKMLSARQQPINLFFDFKSDTTMYSY